MTNIVKGVKIGDAEAIETPLADNQPCGRVTWSLSITHEYCGFEPVQVRSSGYLPTKGEQVYQRRLVVRDWVDVLEGSFVTAPSIVHVHNRGAVKLKSDETAPMVKINLTRDDQACFLISPNAPFVVEVSPGTKLYARATEGEIPITLSVFPK